MKITGYKQFGGRHWDTSAMCNLLAYAGVVAPHTGEPLSEAMCLGVAGGVTAGYRLNPTATGNRRGSGVSIIGRCLMYAPEASFHQGFFGRLGIRANMSAATSAKQAQRNLLAEVSAGRPAIAWCDRAELPLYCESGLWADQGPYAVVVHGADEARDEAYVDDQSAGSMTVPLGVVTRAPESESGRRSLMLTIEAPATLALSRETLRDGIIAGIQACVKSYFDPQAGSCALRGLVEWSKHVASANHERGWLRVFPGGQLYLALRDVYDWIETTGTGGGLFRPMYAEFLEEAAEVTKKKALIECASQFRALGRLWSHLAETALPNKSRPMKETVDVLRERRRLREQKGAAALKEVIRTTQQLAAIEAGMRRGLPLSQEETRLMLESMRGQIEALHEAESMAARALQRAVA